MCILAASSSVHGQVKRRRGLGEARGVATGGFALLLVVVLMAFVVALVLGLAASVRIQSVLAHHAVRQSQARENALFAFNVALQRLQQAAGSDQRATATAESLPNVAPGKVHYTGVWNSDSRSPVWLVSGRAANELDGLSTSIAPELAIELVGKSSAGTENSVIVAAENIEARAPGSSGLVTVGRFAWWVGDQGVKAPVASQDRTTEVVQAPFGDATIQNELGRRLQQRLGRGPLAIDASGAVSFDANDNTNRSTVAAGAVLADSQLAYLRDQIGVQIGVRQVAPMYFTWSANNLAVLADTARGGLRRDLSLRPELLGAAYARWASYSQDMEDFKSQAAAPAILPSYGPAGPAPDPLRRRYKLRPPTGAGSPGIAPVLTYFYVLIGVRKQTAVLPYNVSLRWAAALWNPYTSALVPEDLRLEVSGLPSTLVCYNATSGQDDATLSLAALYGDPLRLVLPWTIAAPAEPDHQSWLPGRTYNWTYSPGEALAAGGDNMGRFYSRDLARFASGLIATAPGAGNVNGSSQLALRLPQSTTLTVKVIRKTTNEVLATYTSPDYEPVATTSPHAASNFTSQLGFLFRLAESCDSPATPGVWLMSPQLDPRNDRFPSTGLRALPNGPNPAAYENYVTISSPDRFFDRDITRGHSYNEDVPVFELPRSPLISVGELQHFATPDARPFSIGNSWGNATEVAGFSANSLFDRFFFSGLSAGYGSAGPMPAVLPDFTLVISPRRIDGTATTAADLVNAPDAMSSSSVLQGGAFNVNSVSAAAWTAILRSLRFRSSQPFTYVNSDPATGTGADAQPTALVSAAAHFLRFPHSGQETYKADPGYAQSLTSVTGTGPVTNTSLFRRGVRSFTASEIAGLGVALAARIRAHLAAEGPFQSIEEFLGPSATLGERSVIEAAILDAGLNAGVAEFSSQWLTQADIMSALAPVLFARSDTFVIRAFGEAQNPLTAESDAAAWCEATVQRLPPYFDATSDNAETLPASLRSELNQINGRRFRITSFRWLARSDL